MPRIGELLGDSALLEAGGPVMVAILGLSVLMWGLILERYRFLGRELGALADRTVREWQAQPHGFVLQDRRLRAALLRRFDDVATAGVGVVEVIAAVLPMVGLLGTVVGMIRIFEVITVFGSGNTRAMADGISQALVTTMAGLVTALSGIYFTSDLRTRAERARERLASRLAHDER
jgi:biopolymer transport protein ExbB